MHKILANTLFLGKDIFYLTECHSSNEVAMSLYRNNLVMEGTIVRCLHQVEGKGQRGNKWHSEAGLNLTFSMVFVPDFLQVNDQFILNMAVSNGIYDAIYSWEKDIKVKWPNDIVHPKGKLGGILIENVLGINGIELSIVGLGLNVNQTVFTVPNALSLSNLKEALLDLEEVFYEVVFHVEKWYIRAKELKFHEIKANYLSHLSRFEKWDWYDDGMVFLGKIEDIEINGKLKIQKQNGLVKSYDLKEIRFV